VLATLSWPTHFVTVVTDLVTIHPAWFRPDAALCFVPTQQAYDQGVQAGMRPERMRICGLPIRPEFGLAQGRKDVVRRQLGIAPYLPVALVIGGAEGMGGVARTARTLAAALVAPLRGGSPLGQLVVICGHDAELENELGAQSWPVPTVVKGFVDDIWTWMAASDCLVTKAGPATIAEAVAVGLPLLLSGHVPGQEEGNIAYVTEHGAGVYARSPGEVAEVVRRWFRPGGEDLALISERARRMGRPDAAFRVAAEIAAYASSCGLTDVRDS
jgi:1,2-diacylglycerol 3-beta-galactosyltransferase